MAAATLSLAKFMLVSETFCENNLQLLFTVLDKSTDPTVRANTIIAAGKFSKVYYFDTSALLYNRPITRQIYYHYLEI
jgi:condensin complex subunit 1